jgi:hypothetical protein
VNFHDDLLLPGTEWNNGLDMGHLRTGGAKMQGESTTNRADGPAPQETGSADHRPTIHMGTHKDKQSEGL